MPNHGAMLMKRNDAQFEDRFTPQKSILIQHSCLFSIWLITLCLIITISGCDKAEDKSTTPSANTQASPQGNIAPPASKSTKAYRSDPSGEKSISVQQIFEDTTNWGGTHRNQIITGYVTKLTIPKDALGRGDKVTMIAIGYDNKSIEMVLNNPLSPGEYKIGDQLSIQGWFNLIGNTYGTGRGDVFRGPVSVIEWDRSKREKTPEFITADDYFEKHMKLGNTPIIIVGRVKQKVTGQDEVLILLGSRMGTIRGALSKSKLTPKVIEQYERLRIGGLVAFKGSFNTELGDTAFFTIEELDLPPEN